MREGNKKTLAALNKKVKKYPHVNVEVGMKFSCLLSHKGDYFEVIKKFVLEGYYNFIIRFKNGSEDTYNQEELNEAVAMDRIKQLE